MVNGPPTSKVSKYSLNILFKQPDVSKQDIIREAMVRPGRVHNECIYQMWYQYIAQYLYKDK